MKFQAKLSRMQSVDAKGIAEFVADELVLGEVCFALFVIKQAKTSHVATKNFVHVDRDGWWISTLRHLDEIELIIKFAALNVNNTLF